MTNRWISDTQVRIKSEVALSNQQSLALKTLLINFQTQLDALAFPNLDKRVKTRRFSLIENFKVNFWFSANDDRRSSRSFSSNHFFYVRTRALPQMFKQRTRHSIIDSSKTEKQRFNQRR